jgi:hypothetical protein
MKVVDRRYDPAMMRWAIVALVVALVLMIASVAAACPNCREGLAESDPEGRALAAGFYYSILFMMSMPFAILGTFGGLAYLSIRRARQQSEVANDVSTV